ncbi:elongation of very long chain fatty acids protein 4-like [Formica exsecta]|uniref:elongation of very long chain fatty acids protein 4-like n=1 Tax=Formica exsecta TaxID=72781 RepID=UPI001142A66E|nr:elongation of very long chain fatty acids protein 4-like [Formica exsecta]
MDFLQEVQRLWTDQLDPRVADFPLIQSSYYVPLIIFAYLYFVLRCGPRFMKNRQPYSLKTFIKLYNIIQIVANTWLFYDYIDAGVFKSSNLVCSQVLDFSYDYIPMKLYKATFYYFLLKILDYVETAIFVLRKKNNQVSGLHLYHHISTLLLAWIATRYFAFGPTLFNFALNSFIHVIMYTYYFLAAYGPNIQKAIAPMKQWITIAQMVQFVILIIYASQNFLPGCKVVKHWLAIIYIGNLMINFYLFYNFYQKAYNKPKRKI